MNEVVGGASVNQDDDLLAQYRSSNFQGGWNHYVDEGMKGHTRVVLTGHLL